MALVRKDSTIQLRLPQELLDRYRMLCDSRGETVSAELRRYIRAELRRYEHHLDQQAEKQRRADLVKVKAAAQAEAEAVLAAQLSSEVPSPPPPPPPSPVAKPLGAPMSLKEKRAMEKAQKERIRQERNDKW